MPNADLDAGNMTENKTMSWPLWLLHSSAADSQYRNRYIIT